MFSVKNQIQVGEIYHIFNEGIENKVIFKDKEDFKRALKSIYFYRFLPKIKLSEFLDLPIDSQKSLLNDFSRHNTFPVDFYSYVLLPDHFHFLVSQKEGGAISFFMSQFQNSYTRYFNSRYQRKGPLFVGRFKFKKVETEDQFISLSFYLHLHPLLSKFVKDKKGLLKYPWSSLIEYIDPSIEGICQKSAILRLFKGEKDYKSVLLRKGLKSVTKGIKDILLETF